MSSVERIHPCSLPASHQDETDSAMTDQAERVCAVAEVITTCPPEVKLNFIYRLDRSALVNLQLTCSTFNSCILNDDTIWRNLFAAENGGYLPSHPPISWRAFYIEQHTIRRNIANGAAQNPIALEHTLYMGYNTFTHNNTYYAMGNYELHSYDLTTGNHITRVPVPNTAFVEPPEREVGLEVIHIRPIDTQQFLTRGAIVAVWDASTESCIFAVETPHYEQPYVDESRLIFMGPDNLVQVLNYRTKEKLAAFLNISDDTDKMLYATDDAVFVLSWHSSLSCYSIRQRKYLFMNLQYKTYSEHENSMFLQTTNHLVIVSRPGSAAPPVAAIVDLQNLQSEKPICRALVLGRPSYPHAAINVQEIAAVHGNSLLGIDPNSLQAVSCWDLNNVRSKKEFCAQGVIYTFHVAEPNRLVATVRDGQNQYRILIWDLNDHKQPIANIQSTSFDCKSHGTLLCIREAAQFRFINLVTAQEIGAVPWLRPVPEDLFNMPEWTFDGTRIHLQQKEDHMRYHWIVNLG